MNLGHFTEQYSVLPAVMCNHNIFCGWCLLRSVVAEMIKVILFNISEASQLEVDVIVNFVYDLYVNHGILPAYHGSRLSCWCLQCTLFVSKATFVNINVQTPSLA